MMFKRIVNNKMLSGMFGESFSFSGGVKRIVVDNHSGVTFDIISSQIPKKVPKKWADISYNAFSIRLTFWGVEELSITGLCEVEEIPFEISETKDHIFIEVRKEGVFDAICTAEFMYIDAITPYLDERWD